MGRDRARTGLRRSGISGRNFHRACQYFGFHAIGRGESLRDLLHQAVSGALQNLGKMKEAEGAGLENDISERLAHLHTLIESIAPLTHTAVNKYRELLQRLQEIAPELQDARVLQEVALLPNAAISKKRSHASDLT